jgi:hypothetical protein
MRLSLLAVAMLATSFVQGQTPADPATTGTLVLRERARFASIGAKDGYTTEKESGTGEAGETNLSDVALYVGDDAKNRQCIGILVFDTSSLPADMSIESARVRLTRYKIAGRPDSLGRGYVDFARAGGALSPRLAEGAAETGDAVNSFTFPEKEGGSVYVEFPSELFPYLRDKEVVARVILDLQTNDNGIRDVVSFYSGNATASQIPELLIDYTVTVPMPAPPAGELGEPQTATFGSIASDDGQINESAPTSEVGGHANYAAPTIQVGDSNRRQQSIAVLSFDTSKIPADAVIDSASVDIYVTGKSGKPDTLGALTLAMRSPLAGPNAWRIGASSSAEIEDFAASMHVDPAGKFGSFAKNSTSSAALTPDALAAINKGGKTQFILRFEKPDNEDAMSDSITFGSGDYGANSPAAPRLNVTWRTPLTQ